MPTITFSKEELQAYLQEDVPTNELRDTITMLGTDIDAFGEEISVEIFPNRPDLLSVPGLARAINAFRGHKPRSYETQKTALEVVVDKSVKDVRAHTKCLVAKGLQLNKQRIEQLIQLQEKLHVTFGRNRKKAAIGIYPREKITPPITYQAQKPTEITFTPLEATKEMNAKQLLTQHATGKKYAHLLEGHKHYPVFRDAKNTVLSVPPIINSQEAGAIQESTQEAFVEVSGDDPRILEQAINIIACALIDQGASIHQTTITYDDHTITSPDLKPITREIDTDYVLQRSNIPNKKDLKESLAKMGITLEENTVVIPPYRTDFLHDVDVIEDALIGYGYDNLKATIPQAYTVGGFSNEYLREEKIREVLAGMRMQEVMTYHLSNQGIPLSNPLTTDYSHLREELLHNLLDVLANNLSNTYPQRIFEVGAIFSEAQTETGVQETPSVAAIICDEKNDYTKARQSLEALAQAMKWELTFAKAQDKRFIPGRCARISGSVEGVIGEIHPEQLAKRKITTPCASFEIHRK